MLLYQGDSASVLHSNNSSSILHLVTTIFFTTLANGPIHLKFIVDFEKDIDDLRSRFTLEGFGAVYSSANIERLKISLIKSVIFLPIIFVPV